MEHLPRPRAAAPARLRSIPASVGSPPEPAGDQHGDGRRAGKPGFPDRDGCDRSCAAGVIETRDERRQPIVARLSAAGARFMEQPITKAGLLHELRAARAEWDALIAEISPARMAEPGAASDWSVKDVIAHLTS